MKKSVSIILAGLLLLGVLASCTAAPVENSSFLQLTPTSETAFDPAELPAYSGAPFIPVNNFVPFFNVRNLTTDSYELYGEPDALGRCTTCVACIGEDLMPTEPRESISKVHPTGWQSVQYDFVDGKSLYNRCHLIGFQLTGENANEQNLITGTRYMNLNMTDYENLIAEYVEDYHAHILYRVTPVFEGDNLVAKGVLMEGMSVEDAGKSVCFCVFLYNVQPGVSIDYKTGNSTEDAAVKSYASDTYVLNTRSHLFHLPDCSSIQQMKEKNKTVYAGSRSDILLMGYQPCRNCQP